MSAIAMMLSGKGFNVSGYDKTKGDVTEKLEKYGISVFYDFQP